MRRTAYQDTVISIHAPREGSDVGIVQYFDVLGISIHAPREGSDELSICGALHRQISIHAPREGSDQRHARNSK